MERYTIEQRVLIVKTYFKNKESFAETVRKLRTIMGRENAPNCSTVKRLINKFEETGSVANKSTPICRREGRSIENIAAVAGSVAAYPKTSTRHRSQELGISRTTLQRILKKDLHLYPYKVQLTQEIKPADHAQRRVFANWILQNQEADNNFSKKILFSDEAHFHLDGYVNTHNCRIWATENPRLIHEKKMHPQKVTVWCGFWAGGIIGPYFFEDEAGNAVTVNGDRYRNMLREFLWPALVGMDLEGMWFQQDGATCHTAQETIHLLQERFPNRVISRNGSQNWPPRSCDLTPCDFWLWSFVKSHAYSNNPLTIGELKNEIRHVIRDINRVMCDNVIENFIKRARLCQQNHGGHLYDILFHT